MLLREQILKLPGDKVFSMMNGFRSRLPHGFPIIIFTILTACQVNSQNGPLLSPSITPKTAASTEPIPEIQTPSPLNPTSTELFLSTQPILFYTHINPDGNRIAAGKGTLPGGKAIDISLRDIPVWVLGAPFQSGWLWAVRLESGEFQAFYQNGEDVSEVWFHAAAIDPMAPFTMIITDERVAALSLPQDERSSVSPPTYLVEEDLLAGVTRSGALILYSPTSGQETQFALDLLPDARILADERGRLLFLSGATDRYSHGVLGDDVEGSRLTLIEYSPGTSILQSIELSGDDVIEGISPIWVDMDQDGQREILVTVSNAQDGARLVIFKEDGNLFASSTAIGTGYRWRHQIAVGPFGPNGELEILSIKTPHLGGIVEYHRINGEKLDLVAQLPGFTSHTIGTRNLDLGVVADFDSDGSLELLLPNQQKTSLGAI